MPGNDDRRAPRAEPNHSPWQTNVRIDSGGDPRPGDVVVSAILRYGVSLAALGIALALTFWLEPILKPTVFLFFFAAIVVSAAAGGIGPAVLAAMLGFLAGEYFFLTPLRRFSFLGAVPRAIIFMLVAALAGWLADRQRTANGELRDAQSRLARREREFRTLSENFPDIIARFDRELRLLYVNVAARAAGSPVVEIIGKSDADAALPAEPVAFWHAHLRQAFETGRPEEMEFELPGPEGAHRHEARLVPEPGPGGEVASVLAILRDVTERRNTEDALRQSEEFNRRLVESSSECVKMLDLQGRILFINDTGLRLMEASDIGAYLNKPLIDFWEEEYRPQVAEALAAGRGGRVGHFKAYRPTETGKPKWWDAIVTPITGANGQVERLLCVSRDVTEGKEAEEAVRESEERLRVAKAAASLGIYDHDMIADIMSWDERMREIWDMPADAPITFRGFLASLHPDDLGPTQAAISRALDPQVGGRLQVEYRVVGMRSGRERWVAVTGNVFFKGGRAVRIVGTVREITERKRAEARMRLVSELSTALADQLTEEEALRHTAAASVSGYADYAMIHLSQEDGSFRRAAAVGADALKQQLVEALGAHGPKGTTKRAVPWVAAVLRDRRSVLVKEITDAALKSMAEDDRHLENLKRLQIASLIISPLVARQRLMGAITLARTPKHPRFDAADLEAAEVFARRAALAIDNARLFAAEKQAKEEAEEANRAKDQFVALISHELRNPLNAIASALHVLHTGCSTEGRSRRALEIVERNAALQARLINDLLDLSRLQRGKLQLQRAPVELVQVVAAACQSCETEAREAGLALSCRCEPDLWVHGDFDRLQQVLLNFLSNAVKFTPPGGTVSVTAERCRETQAQIMVADTGIGMESAKLGHLFQMFHQGEVGGMRAPGLGIGLALVKGIVERHGGRVWAESEGAGRGSRFFLELPLGARPPVDWDARARRQVEKRALRVMLVEDNADARVMVADSLTLAGYEVYTAGSGEEALEEFTDAKPDIMLVDIGLPGMNGFEFLRRAHEMPDMADVPALAVTGYGAEDDVRRGRDAGFVGHFVKPLDLKLLQRTIREALISAQAH